MPEDGSNFGDYAKEKSRERQKKRYSSAYGMVRRKSRGKERNHELPKIKSLVTDTHKEGVRIQTHDESR